MKFTKIYEIKHKDKILANIYIFLADYSKFGKKEVLGKIAADLPEFNDVGYCGLKSRNAAKLHISWSMFGKGYAAKMPDFTVKSENRIIKIISKSFLKCYSTVRSSSTIRIFVFPTMDPFIKNKMSGSSGASFWKNSMTIFVNTDCRGWKAALSNTVCHEYSHAVMHNYVRWKSLLDGIIFDGIAEHFREFVNGGRPSPWSVALTEKEAKSLLKKIKGKLNSRSIKLYNDIFFGTGKYPLWAGYAMGYYIVGDYLKKQKRIDWSRILMTRPEYIMEESGFSKEPLTQKPDSVQKICGADRVK